MDILVGCEESQAVTIELRKRGHNAFSCDLQECSGGHPEWHLKMDEPRVREHRRERKRKKSCAWGKEQVQKSNRKSAAASGEKLCVASEDSPPRKCDTHLQHILCLFFAEEPKRRLDRVEHFRLRFSDLKPWSDKKTATAATSTKRDRKAKGMKAIKYQLIAR